MILVTGGTGLVGGHMLLHILESNPNQAIRATFRSDKSKVNTKNLFDLYDELDLFNQIQWVQADILELTELEACFEGVNQVYHCAALISFKPQDYSAMRRTNIEGTANMVNLSLSHEVEKFCFVSSIAAVEKNPYGGETNEEEDWNSESDKNGYAITKYGAEIEVWRGSQEGLKVIVVNPGVILGPGYWNQGSGTLFRKMVRGMKYYTTGSTGFVGVWDVVKVMKTLMDSTITDNRYILVSENISFEDLFLEMASALGTKAPYKRATKSTLGFAWRYEWLRNKLTGKGPRITKYTAQSILTHTFYSNRKVREALPTFEFEPLKEVIRKTANFYPWE
ncbi:MAG: SDR family oxidoreductase [Flavobacteriaceae bacterium]